MFIINEDKALKAKLSGIKVSDDKNPQRPVGVWFGQPDTEIRQASYPFLTIDLIDVAEAFDRAHRGYVDLKYTPEGADPTKPYATDFPVPINLDYAITSYSRQPRHDRQIMAQLMYGPLALRFGTLVIPEDGTVRRLDFLGFTKRDAVEDGKRLFVNTFTVRVSSEILFGDLNELIKVQNVNLSLDRTEPQLPLHYL